MKFPIRFYCDSWRFCCALGVSAAFRVILTKISKRSGNAVQWNGGITYFFFSSVLNVKNTAVIGCQSHFSLSIAVYF